MGVESKSILVSAVCGNHPALREAVSRGALLFVYRLLLAALGLSDGAPETASTLTRPCGAAYNTTCQSKGDRHTGVCGEVKA
jgi:hypothetical protein